MLGKKLYAIALSIVCGLSCLTVYSAIKLKPGEWRTYYSYNDVMQVMPTAQYVFSLTTGGIFYLDKASEEVRILHKSDGITSGTISLLSFVEATQTLVCIHSDLAIDMYEMNSGNAFTENTIRDKDIAGKVIRDAIVDGTTLYLATDFGIVKYNMTKKEVADSYTIGDNGEIVPVYAMTILGDTIYAATGKGDIRRASKNNHMLSDYHEWTNNGQVGGKILGLRAHSGKLVCLTDSRMIAFGAKGGDTLDLWTEGGQPNKITEYKGALTAKGEWTSVYKGKEWTDTIVRKMTFNEAVYDPDAKKLWAGLGGLLGIRRKAESEEDFDKYLPDGPSKTGYASVSYDRGRTILADGPGYSTLATVDVYHDDDDTWHTFSYDKLREENYKDFHSFRTAYNATLDPNDANRMYVPTWRGVFEFYGDSIVRRYCEWNSTMVRHRDAKTDTNTVVTEKVWFDKNGYMFCTNPRAGYLIHCKSPSGKWTALKHDCMYGKRYGHEHLTTSNGIDVILSERETDGLGIGFVDMNSTPEDDSDDKAVFYSSLRYEEDGVMETINPSRFFCMALDKEGDLWLGTDQGPLVFKNVKDIFTNGNVVVRPKKTREDDARYADYLLSSEKLNALAVDGCNRKWVGTEASGLYMVSADGTEILEHYTTENSILPSDKIVYLHYRGDNGYLYIMTNTGLCVCATDSTDPSPREDEMKDIMVFPNPLRPEYNGFVEVRGLMADTEVRITDMRGNVIVNDLSKGGTFRWDAKAADGSRVAAGVYNIFVSSGDGEIAKHLKVAVVK